MSCMNSVNIDQFWYFHSFTAITFISRLSDLEKMNPDAMFT